MSERILNNRKNGMSMLFLLILLYLCAVAMMVAGGIFGVDRGRPWGIALFVLGLIWVSL